MFQIIGSALAIIFLLLKEWFSYSRTKKEKVKKILKEVPDAKTLKSITRIFDRINRS